MKINMKQEIIRKINDALYTGEISARAALDIMNTVDGEHNFVIINKRVCFKSKEDGKFHDAWACNI